MHWIALSLVSAFFLGLYELHMKHAVRDNAVVPVLFFSTVTGAVVWIVLLAVGRTLALPLPAVLHVAPLTATQHLQLALKSVVVGASWTFSYFAMKHLPISIGSPIRATGPVWTLFGAVVVLSERPTWLQGLGMTMTLLSFLGLSWAGGREGVHFHRNKWVIFMMAGTVLGAGSALYDRYLINTLGFSASAVQAWFSIYLVVVFSPLAIGWWRRWWPRNVFQWRWSVPMIALCLLVADFAYFTALSDAHALISLVSSFRRGSTLVAFAGAIWIFHEPHGTRKLPAVLGVLTGIALTIVG